MKCVYCIRIYTENTFFMKGVGWFMVVEEPLHHDAWLVAAGWSGRQSLGGFTIRMNWL